ncbi:MAG: ATP-binding protein [Magnetococcales bacterium]|nr:ATP-binding protein [Magnetococcales bacterium]
MLIEFTIENFGSFNESQCLEMAATKHKRLSNNLFSTGLNHHPTRVASSALIYGFNASGKSQMVKAAQFMRDMVLNSNRKPVEKNLAITPFLLDPDSSRRPSTLEVAIIANGHLCRYGFKADRNLIWEEWLSIHGSRRGTPDGFRRMYEPESNSYQVEVKGLKGIKLAIQHVPEDWLALTHICQGHFLKDSSQQWGDVQAVYNWFKDKLRVMPVIQEVPHDKALELSRDSERMIWILNFLQVVDRGIDTLQLEKSEHLSPDVQLDLIDLVGRVTTSHEKKSALVNAIKASDTETLAKLGLDFQGRELKIVRTMPKTGDAVSFSANMESQGTNRVFAMAGCIKDVVDNGYVVMIDEMEIGLHYRISRFLLDLFNDPKRNHKGAQMIATTHKSNLLDQSFMRPDQLWMMEKNELHESRLYPLCDLQVKLEKQQTWPQFFLQGNFGKIPMNRVRRVPL